MGYWLLEEKLKIADLRDQIWTGQMAQISDQAVYARQMRQLAEREARL